MKPPPTMCRSPIINNFWIRFFVVCRIIKSDTFDYPGYHKKTSSNVNCFIIHLYKEIKTWTYVIWVKWCSFTHSFVAKTVSFPSVFSDYSCYLRGIFCIEVIHIVQQEMWSAKKKKTKTKTQVCDRARVEAGWLHG